MPNNLFNQFGNNGIQSNIRKQFEQFKQGFKGDPQATVQQMLNSGQITQEQLNQAIATARQFGFLK